MVDVPSMVCLATQQAASIGAIIAIIATYPDNRSRNDGVR